MRERGQAGGHAGARHRAQRWGSACGSSSTTVCVYSLRAKDRPMVSLLVTWEEVARCARERDPARLSFDSDAAQARVEKKGDLFAPLLEVKQSLPRLSGRL